MRFILVFIFFLSCDFADDPISKMFRLSKKIILVKEKITIDPTKADHITPIHHKLFQTLADLAEIYSSDSLKWDVQLKKTRFSLSSKAYVSAKDVYFSFNRNRNLLKHYFGKNFFYRYKSYEKIDETHIVFHFTEKINFPKIAASEAFFIYSKDYSSLDIPIGSANYMIALKPDKNEYVLIPYIEFLHLQEDSIETSYWLNSSLEKIKRRERNYDLTDFDRFIVKDYK